MKSASISPVGMRTIGADFLRVPRARPPCAVRGRGTGTSPRPSLPISSQPDRLSNRLQELELLLIGPFRRPSRPAFEVELLLHLVAAGVGDLVAELPELVQVTAQGAFGHAGADGKLERGEPRLG